MRRVFGSKLQQCENSLKQWNSFFQNFIEAWYLNHTHLVRSFELGQGRGPGPHRLGQG